MYFVGGVAEEVEPVFGLVEGFGEEDQVGAVCGGGLDVHAAEFDVARVDELRFWMGGWVLPRMWVMVEKEKRVDRRRIINNVNINYQLGPSKHRSLPF